MTFFVLLWSLQAGPPADPPERLSQDPPLPLQEEPGAGVRPSEAEPSPALEWSQFARAGVWFTPAFDARTEAGIREIDSDSLFEVGLAFRARHGAWSLAASGTHASSGDLSYLGASVLVGVNVDVALAPGLPVELALAAGPVYGRLEVEHAAFGDFDPGLGAEALLTVNSRGLDVGDFGLWVSFRFIEFEADLPVLSGDRDFGGGTFGLGGALVMRF